MTAPRVVIADDSELFIDVVTETLRGEPDVNLVGVATNGRDAIETVKRLRPDVVVMDVLMPEVDGLEATEAIMAEQPTPILILSADPRSRTGELSMAALARGALDVMCKPESYPFSDHDRRALVERIRFLANVAVVRHVRGRRQRWRPPGKPRSEPPPPARSPSAGKRPRPITEPPLRPTPVPGVSADRVVAIAASTGGPQALAFVLKHLDAGLDAGVVIVQHMNPSFVPALCRWLHGESAIPVDVAQPGEVVARGRVAIAPPDHHLLVEGGRFQLGAPDDAPHCPSADRLFASLARQGGSRTLGVVLTGMGRDGAAGLLALRTSGGQTIVQDAASCVVDGMPRAARAAGAAERVLALDRIPGAIVQWARRA